MNVLEQAEWVARWAEVKGRLFGERPEGGRVGWNLLEIASEHRQHMGWRRWFS